MARTTTVKVSSIGCNQTALNFTRNMPNLFAGTDISGRDKADFAFFNESALTGYMLDDYQDWMRQPHAERDILRLVQEYAKYANKVDPNLVIALGFPFYYADKSQPVEINVGTKKKPFWVPNPLYNIADKPFNATAFISHGKVYAISAKSVQPEGPGEFESRNMLAWPASLGTKIITLNDGTKIPFGKPIVQLEGRKEGEKGGKKIKITVYEEKCAEAWNGIDDEVAEYNQRELITRHLRKVARDNDLSLVFNPSASKPEPFIDKNRIRKLLCRLGAQIGSSCYAYQNAVGLESGPMFFEGGSIFADRKGDIVHTGERYSLADVVYSSAVMEVKEPEKGRPHVLIPHTFRDHEIGKKQGGPAKWESLEGRERLFEEAIRNIVGYNRDWLKKSMTQKGYCVSLSGGKDSAFGAVAASKMIDFSIECFEKELGSKKKAVAAYIKQFYQYAYMPDVLKINKEQGPEAAIEEIKKRQLTFTYYPTDNSSKFTLDAARFLVEGGTEVTVIDPKIKKEQRLYFDPVKDTISKDGKTLTKWLDEDTTKKYKIVRINENVKGIGGTFQVLQVQGIVDATIETFIGLDKKGISDRLSGKISREIKEAVTGERTKFSADVEKFISENIKGDIKVPSWADETGKHDILLQNIQARARCIAAWTVANDRGQISQATSNKSELILSYWTYAGDGHMGMINPCGPLLKTILTKSLTYLEHDGLMDYKGERTGKVPSLSAVSDIPPTAELRRLKKGQIEQFDEKDLIPYTQGDIVAHHIFDLRLPPRDAFRIISQKTGLEDPQKKKPRYTETDLTIGSLHPVLGSPKPVLTHDDGSQLFKSKLELVECIDFVCKRWMGPSQIKRLSAPAAPGMNYNVDPYTSLRTPAFSDAFRTNRALLKLYVMKEELGGLEKFEEHTGLNYRHTKMVATTSNRALRDAIMNTDVFDLMDKPPKFWGSFFRTNGRPGHTISTVDQHTRHHVPFVAGAPKR